MLEEYKLLIRDILIYLKEVDETLFYSPSKKKKETRPIVQEKKGEKFLELEKPKIDFGTLEDVKKIVQKTSVNTKILAETPDDSIAKKIANKWKFNLKAEAVSFLIFQENKQEQIFIQNVAKAVELLLPTAIINAKMIDGEGEWEAFLKSPKLKLLVADKNSIETNLFLKDMLFFPLAASIYLKNPLSKRELWQELLKTIASL